MKVGEHFDVLESKLEKNEEAVTTLIAELYSLFYIRVQPWQSIPYDEFNQALVKYIHTSDKYKLSMKPFSSFLDSVKNSYGEICDNKRTQQIELQKPITLEKQLRSLEVLFLSLAKCFSAHTLEHKLKLYDDAEVPSLRTLQDKLFYDEIVQLFAWLELDMSTTDIQDISNIYFPHISEQFIQLSQVGSDREKIYPILQAMQQDFLSVT